MSATTRMSAAAWLAGATLCLGVLSSCSRAEVSLDSLSADPIEVAPRSTKAMTPAIGAPVVQSTPIVSATAMADFQSCQNKIEQAQLEAALPGAPALEKNRTMVLLRSKAEPVIFSEVPRFTGEVSAGVAARRRAILRSEHPADMYRLTVNTFRDHPERLRQLLLRDGYLYTDDPKAARYLTMYLSLEMLFLDDEIYLQRGSETYLLKRGDQRLFVFANGEQAGERARLLLFDRIWSKDEQVGPAVHIDVREFAQRLGVEGMRPSHLSAQHMVSELRFGEQWVQALIRHEDTKLRLECLAIAPQQSAEVGRARDQAYRRAQVLRTMRQSILQQLRDGLPFDEPKTEVGQQDGKLRARFEQAYFSGAMSYQFNGDKYQVFNSQGEPIPPQVCIDFVTETLERASGMHFAPRGETPRKYLGSLDFDGILQGLRRQELALRSYARETPQYFSLYDYPQSRWVKYEKIDQFFDFIVAEKDRMRPGDIVIIRGRAAWDNYHEIHTHTFYIYEADPVTGVPTLIAGNSGKPRILTWDDEMLRAPKRSIRHRIRPNMEWLYDQLVIKTPAKGERWASPLSVTAPKTP